MIDKSLLNKFLIIAFLSFYFFMAELALYIVLERSMLVLSIWDFIFWVIISLSIYIILIYLTFKSKYYRILISIIYFIISFIPICLALVVYTFTWFDLIFLGIAFGCFIVFFISKKILNIIKISIVSGVAFLVSFGIFIFLFLTNHFIIPKLMFIILSIVSMFGITTSVKYVSPGVKGKSFIPYGKYIKVILIAFPLISAGFLFFPLRSIEIDPDDHPELIFWSSAVELPTDNYTLEKCVQYGITFAVVLRVNYIDDGGASEARKIQRLVDYGIRFHIVIGGREGSFYCSVSNAEEFTEDFKYIRMWLYNNSFYQFVDSFLVDAESPGDYFEQYESEDYSGAGKYFVDNIPSVNALEKAEDGMKEFISLVHGDDKEMGVIMNPCYLDNEDGDYDQSILQRTIYGLNLPWDYSVTMLYRTQRVPSFYDILLTGLEGQQTLDDYEADYYDYDKADKYLMPLSEYYYKVSLEMSGSPVGVDGDSRYMFVGNFDRRNKDTSWVEDKEYKDDMDICKSFGGVDKIFFYEWSSFKSRYGREEIEKLGEHNQDNEKWILSFPSYSLQRELCYVYIVVLFDKFVYLEQSEQLV